MLIIGSNKDIQTNMELLGMVLEGDPVYTNINIQSNKNTEKVILNNKFYRLNTIVDGIIKRIYVFRYLILPTGSTATRSTYKLL
jgi:type V secretory pathway adhesin AidA